MITIEITREQAEAELASIHCAFDVLKAYSQFSATVSHAISGCLDAFREQLQAGMLLFGVDADLTNSDGIEAARAAFAAAFDNLDFDGDELDDDTDNDYDYDDGDDPAETGQDGYGGAVNWHPTPPAGA